MSLLLIVTTSYSQTRKEFRDLMKKWNCVVEADSSTFMIFNLKDATRPISSTLYRTTVTFVALCEGNTIVSWTEEWRDATRKDVISLLKDNEFFTLLFADVSLWSGNIGGKVIITVPQYNWANSSWYINNLFLVTDTL